MKKTLSLEKDYEKWIELGRKENWTMGLQKIKDENVKAFFANLMGFSFQKMCVVLFFCWLEKFVNLDSILCHCILMEIALSIEHKKHYATSWEQWTTQVGC